MSSMTSPHVSLAVRGYVKMRLVVDSFLLIRILFSVTA